MTHLDVAVAIVFHRSKVLIARRKQASVLGGFWEFPGGKVEPGESVQDCVRRELVEELAIQVEPVICFSPIRHQYADRTVMLHPMLCTFQGGTPTPIASDEIRWVSPPQLRDFEFPPANQQLIDEVIAALPAADAPQSRSSKRLIRQTV